MDIVLGMFLGVVLLVIGAVIGLTVNVSKQVAKRLDEKLKEIDNRMTKAKEQLDNNQAEFYKKWENLMTPKEIKRG